MNKKNIIIFILILNSVCAIATAEETPPTNSVSPTETTNTAAANPADPFSSAVFDDKALIEGYTKRYNDVTLEIILEMIKDETLSPYQTTAAIKVLNNKYASGIVSSEKVTVERILLRRLNRTDSPYIQVETMSALCYLDRYRYFAAMVPALIQKLNHYNVTVRESAFNNLNTIIAQGNNRPREARIVFNTLRKILFLERRRLATIKEPGPKLVQKLQILRWSIKVLGSQELQRLPKEVISLL